MGRIMSEKSKLQMLQRPIHHFRLPKVLARRGGKVGRPPKNIRPAFTPDQIETAIQVVMYSKAVYNWVVSEAEFIGVDLNSAEGREFFCKNAREAALRMIK